MPVSLVRTLWLLKWLLVLVLAWDQIASPLHQHRHDSGVDGSWISAHAEEAGSEELHMDEGDHSSGFMHAITAVQLQSASVQLSAASEPHVLFFAFAEIFDLVHRAEPQALPTYIAPIYPSFRSLPPGGRAPPLHT